MENANRIALKKLIDEYRTHYNVPVEEWRAFGKMMAAYTDSSTFYLEAAGEALEDWNNHGAAALVRRVSDGSLGVDKALVANEMYDCLYTLLGMVETGYPEADNDPDIKYARAVLNAAENKIDWKFWSNDQKERAQSINNTVKNEEE